MVGLQPGALDTSCQSRHPWRIVDLLLHKPQTLKTTTFEPTAESFRCYRHVSCCDRRLHESLRFGQGEVVSTNGRLFPRSTSEPREFIPLICS